MSGDGSCVAAAVLSPFVAIAASVFLPLWGILAIGNAVCSEITGGENLAGRPVDLNMRTNIDIS